ncbi:3-deoxy-manno-octulosonate cytidylyltransferase [Zooshikella ganghwensis]|uniref:3-deoxy-manno-octulosonate cytidylyltransferase n=1 Tax=Zooshikella ganghwensis TaxID=202772 RepID=UPI00040699D4|nr:3-deoxy-manno-octulosonate cytidylyltransferase [Zooshikella ganghwensis]
MNSTDYTVIIPARYASSRLPAKPLADIAGKPMVQRVYEQACASNAKRVVIATDHPDIVAAVQKFGAEVCLTDADHPSGTDRLQQAASELGLDDDAVVVNVQGDEPLIPPALIDQVAHNLRNDRDAVMATLCQPITELEMMLNPNVVKVVTDAKQHALYFSRAAIPWPRDEFAGQPQNLPAGLPVAHHIGIYAYRVSLLNDFVSWGSCLLERTESLEQLRVLWHGKKIHVAQALVTPPRGVDTKDDLLRVCQLLGELN